MGRREHRLDYGFVAGATTEITGEPRAHRGFVDICAMIHQKSSGRNEHPWGTVAALEGAPREQMGPHSPSDLSNIARQITQPARGHYRLSIRAMWRHQARRYRLMVQQHGTGATHTLTAAMTNFGVAEDTLQHRLQ
jgi:hypothetical protein